MADKRRKPAKKKHRTKKTRSAKNAETIESWLWMDKPLVGKRGRKAAKSR
jgi:hypothetical protein